MNEHVISTFLEFIGAVASIAFVRTLVAASKSAVSTKRCSISG